MGENKFTYDVWGDTVNTAALMEKGAEKARINISSSTFQHVGEIFEIEERGPIASGKKGDLPMYFLNGLKPEYCEANSNIKANNTFQQKYGRLMKIYDN